MVDKSSQWYPYYNTQPNYYDLSDALYIPRKICDYLIDAPRGEYMPPDNNSYSRCRFWKYLYYDGARPLDSPLPTIAEKMSVVFDPDKPTEPPTDKGYRLIPQVWTKQAQTDAQTRVYVYMGRTLPQRDEFKISLGVTFFIWTHYQYELNTRQDEYSRAFNIEQALIEALNGVNMAGIGTFYFDKGKHSDCGSNPIYDGDTNVGRELTIALELMTTAQSGGRETSNMPDFNGRGVKIV